MDILVYFLLGSLFTFCIWMLVSHLKVKKRIFKAVTDSTDKLNELIMIDIDSQWDTIKSSEDMAIDDHEKIIDALDKMQDLRDELIELKDMLTPTKVFTSTDYTIEDVDFILDKIRKDGIDSISDDDKIILAEFNSKV